MSFGLNQEPTQPRTGVFGAKILKGARFGELAIELPAKFDLNITLKASRALGLTMPQALLQAGLRGLRRRTASLHEMQTDRHCRN